MATEALSYTGINRAYSDFAGSHACEELINLRPATEGVVPVKEALERMSNVPYYKVFVHHTTAGPKYIAIGRNLADVYAKYLEYDEENELWVEKKTLFTVSAANPTAAKELLDKVYYASAGNVLAFSVCDPGNKIFRNYAFTWKWSDKAFYEGGQWVGGETYVTMDGEAPDVSFDVVDDGSLSSATEGISPLTNASSKVERVSSVESGLNAIQENNPDLCLGPIVIAIAFKTNDGNTFWTGNWRIYDPTATIGDTNPPYVDEDTYTDPNYADFFDKYDHGYLAVPQVGPDQGYGQYQALDIIKAYGTNVRLEFDQVSGWDEDSSIIQSLEVYCSRPQVYLDAESAAEGLQVDVIATVPFYTLILSQRKYEDMDLGGQLLYHQASIPMASLASGDQVVNLTFGGNQQVTEDTLDTDAGALKRFGRLLSYNARFHYWDSESEVEVGMPYFSIPPDTGSTPVVGRPYIFARYADTTRDDLVYFGTTEEDVPLANKATVVIAPSVNIKEVIMYFLLGGVYIKRTYRMESSSSYNFSINTDGGVEDRSATDDSALRRLINAGVNTTIFSDEPDAINVSEQYNPFVFLVEHSYKAPGNILDVQTQMAGITDSSYGRDPLNVFTERGTYALTQGSANVLYGAFLPVSNSVISRKDGGCSLPTEMGVFFLADGALWLLSGRRATLISDALHLGPHKYIRDCDGYQKISGGGQATPEYDVSTLVSAVTFEEYVRNGGRLGYNRFRMELYVSNKNYPYTYVLSLKYKQWFKIGKCVWQDDLAGDLINTPGEGGHGLMTILDLSTETDGDVLVHLQTRPLSMGYRYIHMHRIVSMVRAKLSAIAGEKLVVGLYGSDNLQDWKLLAYAKRAGTDAQTEDEPPVVTGKPLKISQIRTSSSARSWRYYTICIGGIVPTDTDLGSVLVDYQPVIRRIG